MIDDNIKAFILQRYEISSEPTQDLLILYRSNETLNEYKKKGLVKFQFNNYPISLSNVNKEQFLALYDDPDIESIEPDELFYLQLNEVSRLVKSSYIHNSFFGFSGKGVLIGLIDSGIDESHPDLANQLIGIHNFTEETNKDFIGHGTAIAGAICGNGNASKGKFKGIALDAKLVLYKLFDKTGTCHFSEFIVCLEEIITDFSSQQIDLLCLPFINPIPSFKSQIIERYLQELNKLGIAIIAAAGNFGPDPNSLGYPATSNWVISIGSYDDRIQPAFFSSRGFSSWPKSPDLIMKGTNIITIKAYYVDFGVEYNPNPNYTIVSGSSISAGIMTGICAIIKEAFPLIKPNELKEEILKHCYRVSNNDKAEGKGTFDLQTYFLNKNMVINNPIPYSILLKSAMKISIYFICALTFLLFLIEYILEKNRGL